MRVVVQRVASARVEVDQKLVANIGRGILLLVGFRESDTEQELDWMARKCLELRIFEDEGGKMNRSVMDERGEVLIVSQFTLYGDCRKGRRPSYTESAPASVAIQLYRRFVEIVSSYYPDVKEGIFGAKMKVSLINDGPVTLIIDKD